MTLNDLERRYGPYFALSRRIFVYDVVVKQLLGLPRFQNLVLIVYDHITTICAIIRRLGLFVAAWRSVNIVERINRVN